MIERPQLLHQFKQEGERLWMNRSPCLDYAAPARTCKRAALLSPASVSGNEPVADTHLIDERTLAARVRLNSRRPH